jgi:uncharacterized protein
MTQVPHSHRSSGDRALNPGNKYPDWQQAIAARSALRAGFYRPGRDASKVACPLLVLVCDQDQTALAAPAVRTAQRAPHAELVRLHGGHYAPFLDGHEQAVHAELSFLRRRLRPPADRPRPAAADSALQPGGSSCPPGPSTTPTAARDRRWCCCMGS